MQHSTLLLSGLALFGLISCKSTIDEIVPMNYSPIETRCSDRSSIGIKTIRDHEVTKTMAELFINSDKNNPAITQVEPYELDGLTCFYIINFKEGFKVISADTRTTPILAESDKENIDLEDVHYGLKVWMEDVADIIRVIKTKDIDTKEDYSAIWQAFASDNEKDPQTRSWPIGEDSVWIKTVDYSYTPTTVYAHVPPLIQTKWGQSGQWNISMPSVGSQHCLTGCAAVAISQILYYFHAQNYTPNDLWHNISILSQNSDNTVTLNKSQYTTGSTRWSQMPLYNNLNNVPYQYVSDLMLDIGERIHIHYGTLNSFVSLDPNDYHIPYIAQCGITSSYDSFNFSTVKNNLMNELPLIAIATTSDGTGSHIWIIDGCDDYIQKTDVTTTYNYVAYEDIPDNPAPVAVYSNDDMLRMYPNAYDGMQIIDTSYSPYQRIRMNWGYDGVGDSAYYAVLPTSNWYYGSYNFIYNRHIYYNISTSQLN